MLTETLKMWVLADPVNGWSHWVRWGKEEEQLSWWEISGVTGDLFASSVPETADGDGSWQGKTGRRPFSRRGQIAERVFAFLWIFAFQVLLWPTSCLNYTCLHSSSNCTSYGKKEGQVIIRSRSQTWFSAQDHVRVELKPPKPITGSQQFWRQTPSLVRWS